MPLAQDQAAAKDLDIENDLILPIATLLGISLLAMTADLAAPAPQATIGLTLSIKHEAPPSTHLEQARSNIQKESLTR
ncbi:hypothetical protein N7540_005198 [Penicillium herquei]|nr:hypothetical protein N7540_005198 [Penicillium herquei]